MLLAVAALTAATSCSSGPTPAPTGSAAASAGVAPGGQASATITVTEKEFSVSPSQTTVAPGTYTLVVENAGAVAHSLAVSGPGVSNAKTSTIPPGGREQLTVTLQAGSYDLWCPIDNHRALGMETHLQVGGSGPASPAPGSATASPTG
ncbi:MULTISPECIES: cupredoxin domain-containing protein [Kitasatospora]